MELPTLEFAVLMSQLKELDVTQLTTEQQQTLVLNIDTKKLELLRHRTLKPAKKY